MRNLYYVLLGLCIFCLSCHLGKALDYADAINDDLKSTFGLDKTVTSIGSGSDVEDNRVQVSCYEYEFGNMTNNSLDSLAFRIRNRIIEKHPEMKKLNHIEIRFTKEIESDNNGSFVSFKYK